MRTASRMRSRNREHPRPRSPRRWIALLLVAAASLGASACSAAPPQTDAAAERIAWDSCGPNLECTDVPVPLDWSDPGGEQITLAVIKYPAPDAEHRIGTLFINPGGPGDTGVGLVKGAGSGSRGLGRWTLRRRLVGSARHARQLTRAVLRDRRRARPILGGRPDPLERRRG